MLKISELTVSFPSTGSPLPVLDGVNLQIEAGEKLGLVGESGSGKTSLALTLMGLSPGEKQGSVTFQGEELLEKNNREWEQLRGGSISMVMQQSGEMLTPVLSLGKQVAEPYLKQYPGRKEEAYRRTVSLLKQVGLGESYVHRYPYTLSGGEVQRSMLAMALITEPAFLILDEPVSSLDALTREEILQLLKNLTRNCSVLVISHDLSTVARLAERTAVLYSGCLLEKAPTEELFQSPLHPYSRALVRAYPTLEGVKELQGIRGEVPSLSFRPRGCPFHPRCTQTLDRCRRERPILEEAVKNENGGQRMLACHRGGVVELLRGRDIRSCYPLDGGGNGRAGYLEAVRGVDVYLDEGEVYALVGESGSGKTTLGKSLAGVDIPNEGEVYFQEKAINKMSRKEARETRRCLQMLFQNSGEALSHRFNVHDLVAEPLVIQGIGDDLSRRKAIERSLDWVRLPRDEDFMHRYPHQLSGGELQRVALARALVMEPRVLVADEPSASLDASVQAKIIKLLLHLQNERGFALFLITHDLALAARAGDRMGVMYGGMIVEEGPSSRLVHRPLHPYTRRLLQAAPTLELPPEEPSHASISGTENSTLQSTADQLQANSSGCSYAKVCHWSSAICFREKPPLREIGSQKVACHHLSAELQTIKHR